MALAKVTLDPSKFARIAAGAPGQRVLNAVGQRVAGLARQNSASNGSIPRGIIVGPVIDRTVQVISTNPHSILVHQGSRPHKIRPRRTGRFLRFEVEGRVVYAREVNHPGYRGNPFLTDALRQAGDSHAA